MGKKMTIEQAKEILKAYDFGFTGCTGSLKDAISTVFPIVEKYQKIEQIVSDFREYQKGITWGFGGEKYMQMVSEVVEDDRN